MNKLITLLATKLLPLLITNVSPEFRKSIAEGLDRLELNAKESVNPWDDLAISFLRSIINI